MSTTTLELTRFTSTVLADNPLGDPATRRLPVILPPNYDPSRRYPVLYGLAGLASRGAALLNDRGWDPQLMDRLDRLYANGMPHMIVALPDCFTSFGGSQYVNSAAVGQYDRYVVDEVVPFVDATFATVAEAGGRGLFGHSSGGYGAMVLGMRHPDVFGALACHSGDMGFEWCFRPSFPHAATSISRAGGVDGWLTTFESRKPGASFDFETLNILAMAACYSPNPDAPRNIDLPFDTDLCELRPDVWARWLDHDPLHMAKRHADALRSMRLVFMDCGTRDEAHLHYGARRLARHLNDLDIPHQYEEFDGGHRNTQYRFDTSLPLLARALS